MKNTNSIMTPNKDRTAWLADVSFVMHEKQKGHGFIKNPTCAKALWETPSYDVVTWYHPGYTTTYAVAKDGSHTVAWREDALGIHRW